MRVGLFASHNSRALEISGPMDAFGEANPLLPDDEQYELVTISEVAEPVLCSSGVRLLADCSIENAPTQFDTLIIVGSSGIPDAPSRRLVEWLRVAASSARRSCSVGTGTFLLGPTGILDRRAVTTHWQHVDKLATDFPSALVDPDRIFIQDGSLYTSAGVTAGIDLTLALIEEDHGRDLALAVARQMVVYLKRPGGQSQYSVQLAGQAAVRSPIQDIQQWIRDNLEADLSNSALAKRAAMSERNFSRVFRDQTGMTVAEFVELTRTEAAQHLLEQTGLPMQSIASKVGFKQPETMRRVFVKRLGMSAKDYRASSLASTQKRREQG